MKKTSSGFTIVELLIVIVVIGILAAITIVAYNGIQQRGKDASMKADLANAAKKFELYNADFGRYPVTSTEATTMKVRFSFSPVGNNVLFCGNSLGSGYAVFVQQNSKQYKVVSGQAPQEVSPMLTWDPTTLCASTPYFSIAWGNFWVDGA